MAGRKKLPLDGDQVFKLAKLGCTVKEIADILNCSDATINNRFQTELIEGRANLKMSLRDMQLKMAKKGSAVLLIWLGKQMLGQSDVPVIKQEDVSDDNGREELLQELGATMDRINGPKSDTN